MVNGFIDEINHLSSEIDITIERLNEKSIWLFLATIGCWGVTHKDMQLFAMLIIAFYFFDQVFRGNLSNKSYSTRIVEIETSALNSSISEDEKNQVVGALKRYCSDKLRVRFIITMGMKYIFGAAFYFISLCLFLPETWPTLHLYQLFAN